MGLAIKNDREAAMETMNENEKNVRGMVMESYQDMLAGKGRDHKDFFDEMENRYKHAKV